MMTMHTIDLARGRLLQLGVAAVMAAACSSKDTTGNPPPPPPNTPVIALAPAAVVFNDTLGATAPAPVVVAVTNGGSGSLTGLSLDAITFAAGGSGWLSAKLDSTM